MKKLFFPRLKISKPRRSKFYVLEDLANNSPRYLLMKGDLIDLAKQIANLFGNFTKGGDKE